MKVQADNNLSLFVSLSSSVAMCVGGGVGGGGRGVLMLMHRSYRVGVDIVPASHCVISI